MATFKKLLVRGCVINTVITTCFYLLAAFLEGFEWIPSLGTMFMILALSFIVSAAEQILSCPFSMAGRVTLNYIICLGGFLLFFVIGNKNGGNGAQVMIAAAFFTLLYLIVNLARFIAMGRKAKLENEKLEYTPSFKK